MIRLAGQRHLRQNVFRGPAERTLIELWLTDLVGLAINGYPEAPPRMMTMTTLTVKPAMAAPTGAFDAVTTAELAELAGVPEPAEIAEPVAAAPAPVEVLDRRRTTAADPVAARAA